MLGIGIDVYKLHLSALLQVMWSTFAPYVPNSILPGSIAFVIAVAAVVMARLGKLSEKSAGFVSSVSAWTATLLFMWMPIAQFVIVLFLSLFSHP